MALTMEKISVVITGAGPAGLALALSLAKYEVHVRRFLFEYIRV
jgi:2-polyprenyl-6-methoxyphenol hydroxylase-like FAD-dependent oxidoreductase